MSPWVSALIGVLSMGNIELVHATWQSTELQSDVPYILEKTKEEVLMFATGDRASVAIYNFSVPYDLALSGLYERIATRFGVDKKESSRSFGFIGLFDDMSVEITNDAARRLWKESWESSITKMQTAGFGVSGLHQTKIQSKRYNQFPSRDGFSILYMNILDAQDVVGVRGSIVIMYRIDQAKEWWWKNPHDPFSFGYSLRVGRYVTRTEHSVIDEWAKQNGVAYGFSPLGANPIADYLDEWKEIRKRLTKPGSR